MGQLLHFRQPQTSPAHRWPRVYIGTADHPLTADLIKIAIGVQSKTDAVCPTCSLADCRAEHLGRIEDMTAEAAILQPLDRDIGLQWWLAGQAASIARSTCRRGRIALVAAPLRDPEPADYEVCACGGERYYHADGHCSCKQSCKCKGFEAAK